VRSPADAPVTSFKAFVDGRPVGAARAWVTTSAAVGSTGEAEQQVSVPLPERDCEVAIIAENKNAASVPATVRLRWRGAKPAVAGTDTFTIKPKLYILAVGVSKYDDPDNRLTYPAKDARDFVAALLVQKGGLYRDVEIKLLTDADATKDNILDGLDWVQKQTTSKDVAVVFLSGHGLNDTNGIYYYLPVNFTPERIKSRGLPFSDIKTTLEAIAGKALFFVDTCHSGNVLGAGAGTKARGSLPDITGLVNELSSAENGVVVFASSTGKQVSLENETWNNGAFTKALVEGLTGKADYNGKGRITINMLDLYLSERVKELTAGRQSPTTTKPQTIQDFPIAVIIR